MSFKLIKCGGKTVPSLIFGSLTMAPLQRNMSASEGAKIIAAAIKRGLRWIDTAQMYGSYSHVRAGLESAGINKNPSIL